MIKIYLDIDGVLLSRKQTIPNNAEELIHYLIRHFDCYWLTTHCRGGENKTVEYLCRVYGDKYKSIFDRIKPTNWSDLKTEAIDFNSNFYWLEDFPFESEKEVLRKNDKLNSLVLIDLINPSELIRVLNLLKNQSL